jgi:ligand-binding sensor domain-containing protein
MPKRFSLSRKSLIAATILIIVASAIAIWRIKVHTQSVLDAERARLEKQNLIPFEKKVRPVIDSKQIEFWQSSKDSRAVARFKDSYFVATDGGLVELDSTATFLRRYSVLDGLPESDLVSLASFNAKLFIGTRTSGLISFDGDRFESYRWLDRSPQAINALFEDAGRLLIGTMAGGLIEFDGQQFKEIRVGADHKRLPAIIHLSKNGSRLFVGTFADGLWIEEGARWIQFTVAEGLPSNRVVGVVADLRNLYVASDYGLASAPFSAFPAESTQTPGQSSAKLFQPVAVLPSLASIVQFGSNILLCKDNGEGFVLRVDNEGARLPQLRQLGSKPAATLSGRRLVMIEKQLWVLSNEGVRCVEAEPGDGGAVPSALVAVAEVGPGAKGQQAHARAHTPGNSLTNNLIAALAVDLQGRLWAGGFRTGIDVLTPEGQKLAHLESDTNREINSLIADQKTNTMLAATSQGLLSFDANLRAIGRLSMTEGLLSNAVMQAAANQLSAAGDRENSYFAFATGKGLTIGATGKLRSLTTVQGLPSNSLYTVLVHGRDLYVGTLSGLALIQDGRVVRVFKGSNSNLTTNWVTALCLVGSRLFVGTYGGGVFELTPSGELVAFRAATGRAVVNPNAMWSDGKRLYAGTLDGALMFDSQSQTWTGIKAELPSHTVLSITGDERYVYFGTTSGIARIERSYWNQVESTWK